MGASEYCIRFAKTTIEIEPILFRTSHISLFPVDCWLLINGRCVTALQEIAADVRLSDTAGCRMQPNGGFPGAKFALEQGYEVDERCGTNGKNT